MDRRFYKQLREIERTHWWFAGRRRVLLGVLERLDVQAGAILDVGCGAGSNLDLLRERFAESAIHGIDIEIEPLRYCREDHAAKVLQADLAQLPFRDEAFDLVCALDALEHVPDDESALRGLHRVCAPGGKLFVTVPAFPFLWGNVDRVGHHFRRYRRPELVDRISRAGFSVRFVRYFNTLLFPPIAAVRLAALLRREREPVEGAPVRTDFDLVSSGPVNAALARVFGAEAALLRWRLPFGVSLVCVAERPVVSGAFAATS
jgi:SAM-dependent methyltransferase